MAGIGVAGHGGAWCDKARIFQMGRKPKPAGEKKTNVLRILMTEKDRAALERAAKKSGLDVSTWARMKLLELAAK